MKNIHKLLEAKIKIAPPGKPYECGECHATGWVRDRSVRDEVEYDLCPSCDGQGWLTQPFEDPRVSAGLKDDMF